MSACVARAADVARYQHDFALTGAPIPGWSYLWNANGPMGNPANYVPLVRDTRGNFETQANGVWPDSGPGGSIAITPTTIYPGQGTSGGNTERFAIAAYTVTAADVAASGGGAQMAPWNFTVADTSDGMHPAIYVNSSLAVSVNLGPGDSYSSSTYPPVSLGALKPGDTIYVAIGAGRTNNGDRLDLDYTISLSSTLKVLSTFGSQFYGSNIAATVNTIGVDLANHDALYSFGTNEQASAYNQVRQWIVQGQAGQQGIYTSSLIFPGNYPAVIAPIDNRELHLTDFDGTPVASQDVYNQILLKYTRLGDTNLDGVVTDADLVNIVANMGHPGSYIDGDVNLDGMVDVNDFNLVTTVLAGGAGAQFVNASSVTVPEPGAVAFAGLAMTLGGRIRRRRR